MDNNAKKRVSSPNDRAVKQSASVPSGNGEPKKIFRRKTEDLFGRVGYNFDYSLASTGCRMQWVKGDRLRYYIEDLGYVHIQDENGSNVRKQVGTHNGEPVYMYAVEVDEEIIRDADRRKDEVRRSYELEGDEPRGQKGVSLPVRQETGEEGSQYLPASVPLKKAVITQEIKETE